MTIKTIAIYVGDPHGAELRPNQPHNIVIKYDPILVGNRIEIKPFGLLYPNLNGFLEDWSCPDLEQLLQESFQNIQPVASLDPIDLQPKLTTKAKKYNPHY